MMNDQTYDVAKIEALVDLCLPRDEKISGGIYPKCSPLISLEQYFEGTNATMWCNVYPFPENLSEPEFWSNLRKRKDVHDIRFWLRQIDTSGASFEEMVEDVRDGGAEVYSDSGVIISTASLDEIEREFVGIAEPDVLEDITEKSLGPECEAVSIPPGMRAYLFWYD